MSSPINDLIAAIRARTAVVALDAPAAEELTTLETLASAIEDLKQGFEIFTWSEASGLQQLQLTESGITREDVLMAGGAGMAMNPVQSVLGHIRTGANKEPGVSRVFVLLDAHPHINGGSPAQSGSIRRVKELALTLKASATSVVLLGEGIKLDPSLDGLVPTIIIGLPEANSLRIALEQVLDDLEGTSHQMRPELVAEPEGADRCKTELVTAALGLTCEEFADALRLASFKGNGIDFEAAQVIRERKLQKLRRLGADFASAPDVVVGGLDQLMAWVNTRRKLLTPEAEALGMPLPKGLLLVGVPGTGKSLVAKSIGAAWGLPVMALDVGSLYGGVVGQTEQNVRKLLATADACAPCILLIDELEKALAGVSGHNGDGGVSQRLFGSLLSWMNDHQSRVFVVATANDITCLPPELKRKGRFDEIFVVGLPTSAERGQILRAHVDRQEIVLDPSAFTELVELTADFTGAEIGAVVQTAKVEQFCGTDGDIAAILRRCVEQAEPQFKGVAYDCAGVNARPASSPETPKRGKARTVIR